MLMSAFAVALSLVSSIPLQLPPAPAPPLIGPMIGIDEPTGLCPVCGNAIPFGKGSKIMVRGREYAVDDGACGEALAANPDKYLDPDGTPKNAKKKDKSE